MEWILLIILAGIWYYGHSICSQVQDFKQQQDRASHLHATAIDELLEKVRLIDHNSEYMASKLQDILSQLPDERERKDALEHIVFGLKEIASKI